MEGLYHGYAIGNDAFFANTEAEALAEFGKRVGCEVRKCVYPVRSERVYCISEHGDLFGLIRDDYRHVFIGYSAKPRVLHNTAERPTPGVWHGVKHYLSGKDTVVKAEKLVYCTFVLGEWRDDVIVQFKDGDQYNVCLENLEEPSKEVSPLTAKRMAEYSDIYRREFKNVVSYVAWVCGIRDEEAQDCAQDTFIWLITRQCALPQYFVGAWMYWSKFHGFHVTRDSYKHCELKEQDCGGHEPNRDIDLLSIVKNDKHREMLKMKLQGYMEAEIAKKFGTTQGTVRVTMQRVIRMYRDYFARDFKVLGIKPPDGRRGNLFI